MSPRRAAPEKGPIEGDAKSAALSAFQKALAAKVSGEVTVGTPVTTGDEHRAPAKSRRPKRVARPSRHPAPKKAAGRVRVTPEIEARIRELHDDGLTGQQIADRVGFSGPTVSRVLSKKTSRSARTDSEAVRGSPKGRVGEEPTPSDDKRAEILSGRKIPERKDCPNNCGKKDLLPNGLALHLKTCKPKRVPIEKREAPPRAPPAERRAEEPLRVPVESGGDELPLDDTRRFPPQVASTPEDVVQALAMWAEGKTAMRICEALSPSPSPSTVIGWERNACAISGVPFAGSPESKEQIGKKLAAMRDAARRAFGERVLKSYAGEASTSASGAGHRSSLTRS